jgi:predicted esterase
MQRELRLTIFTLFALLLVQPAIPQNANPDTGVVEMLTGTPFEKHEITDSLGRQIVYYISKPESPAPLLLMIQGSGCARVMNVQTGGVYSTLFNLLPFAKEGQFAVMAVEKPYSGVVPNPSGQSSSANQSCTPEFNDDFTAESWLVALQASLQDARQSSWIDKERTLVFGFSEGAVMAAMLAGNDTSITDVISIGGSGTTQLFDFFAFAYQRCPDVTPCLDAVEEQHREILADPLSSSKFAWGHPYKRWTSFFRADLSSLLLQSNARIYMAFGTADDSVPALSQELAVARLLAAGKKLTVRRVPNANHALMSVNAPSFNDIDQEYRAALQWFVDADL